MSEMSNKWINWIEEAVSKKHIKFYEYKHFKNIQEIGAGGFGNVYRANWKHSNQNFALKSLLDISDVAIKELVHEIELQREVTFHDNVISFYGVTISDKENNDNFKKYLLVMEYADGGTLKRYLKENFKKLTWNDKYRLAYQLASAVSCLHDEEIVHRDLHSNNILIRQNTIKLSDFGLSKRIEEASKTQSDLFGIVPYIDPKKFSKRSYSLNKKSDVYSVGVLLWEISNGQPPFYVENEPYDGTLAVQIIQGLRETTVPDTPIDYAKLYTECWDGEPNNRPDVYKVVERLNAMIPQSNIPVDQQPNENFNKITDQANKNMISSSIENSSHGELSRMIQDFDKMTANDIEYMTSTSEKIISRNILPKNDLNITVNEVNKYIFEITNKGIEPRLRKQHVLDYISNLNISTQEIYKWLLYNQNDSDSIFLLGYFNYHGVEISVNYEKAFNLFVNASEKGHILAQYYVGDCYLFGYGIMKNEKLAFKYYEKVANKNLAFGQNSIACCYENGLGVKKDSRMASCWYEKAANNGNIMAMYNLGYCYQNGTGIEKDYKKAFKLFNQSAEGGYLRGITILGHCYNNGIGTNIDKKKAFELYQKSANLGEMVAQNNLAVLYENGYGIGKDKGKAIYWYEKSAKQGYQLAQNNLEILLKNK